MAGRNKRNGNAGAAIKALPDLRRLSWPEIHRQFHNPAAELGKLALVRQLAENHWQGRYKNSEKGEVERFLRSFIDLNDIRHKINVKCLLGYDYLPDDVCQKLTREALFIVFTFLSRSKVDGATQGLIDIMRQNPPDDRFLREAELAVRSSHP